MKILFRFISQIQRIWFWKEINVRARLSSNWKSIVSKSVAPHRWTCVFVVYIHVEAISGSGVRF